MAALVELPQIEPGAAAALAWAHPVVAEWFLTKFGSATEPQIEGWPAILRGETTLISAPTGSGKTLAAFLVAIDQLLRQAIAGSLPSATQVVYVSPLKALSNDVQKNLDGPLAEIQQLAAARGYLCPPIRTGVRTGDTLPSERARMLRTPPHILVTTPESLYLLLTAAKSRENLRQIRTVIVDEIHAVADDKRGAHLALSLERLDALVCGENRLSPGAFLAGRPTPPQRIGLSATQNPISLVADFLTGSATESGAPGLASETWVGATSNARAAATIIQVGQRRALDLAIEIPTCDELGSVTTTAMWEEVFDRLAAHALAHRSTLVFVNTRRLVEKIAFALGERLTPHLGPDCVAAHHGSLSRELRLDAEQRLKTGQIRILIATASLELGIDIGNIDLVCQISSTRAVAVAMQRVGRAGHWRGAIPKGRLFATTRDDLLEQTALVRKMRAGELDRLEIPPQPIDVLMQQIVASVAAEPWEETALFNVLRRAYPYRDLTRELFDEIVKLLSEGIESSRGRYGAYLLRDGVHGQLHPRRGSRAIAIANGGAIPDTALFNVILQPEGLQIATLDEHFAVESSPGDVILLGNTSWRVQRVEAAGRVLVEDAHGAPPSLPFWFGEAPGRTAVLSSGVAELREQISALTPHVSPTTLGLTPHSDPTARVPHPSRSDGWDVQGPAGETTSLAQQEITETTTFLTQQCGVCLSAARQLIAYIVAGRAILGAVPSKSTIIAERFFDEGGGMQLILHAPFGARLNKAWGLALRKRFCRGFNFELQAAATDNGINISLAEQHSFPLSDVFHFLTEHTAKELLEQAAIASPIFKTRWRWAANRSLQLLRMSKGKRIAPQIQRIRSDDLLASVFPQAAACFETIVGDIQIPDHPLVNEVMYDVLQEAMDLEGLNEVLRGIATGSIRCLAVDTPVPSQFAHELINANPYAFLDDAGLEERRTRAVSLRRAIPDSVLEGAGCLDQAAISTVRRELWPDLRDEHELHDLLHSLIAFPLAMLEGHNTRHWPHFFDLLAQTGRARAIDVNGVPCWVATERLHQLPALFPPRTPSPLPPSNKAKPSSATEPVTNETTLKQCVQGWLQITGPITATSFAQRLNLDPAPVFQTFLALEMQGLLMRGAFEQPATEEDLNIEWCERRILQRIHRLTLATARKQVEAVAPAVYMRWLLGWQHLAPQTQLSGEEGVLAALEQLEGFEAPAVEWERTLLPARIANYSPTWLDQLCLSGAVGWGRISPHPAWFTQSQPTGEGVARPRRVIPTNAAPITFYVRESAQWLPHTLAQQSVQETTLAQALSPEALRIRAILAQRGACFAADLQRITGLTRQQTSHALWELATAGIAAADGFDQLRALMDPRRKSNTADTPSRRATRTTAGRWSLLNETVEPPGAVSDPAMVQAAAIAQARQTDAAIESFARVLLARYGILFRDLLARESNAPKWRDLLGVLRRLEARGEVRGGRFVSGFGGEQFALPEAADSLRASRHRESQDEITVAAADPMNLAGIVVPGERVAAVPGKALLYRNGSLVSDHPPEGDEAQSAATAPIAKRPRPASPVFPATLPEPTPPAATLL
jgi:ATP-dependent Lhr-like helicase